MIRQNERIGIIGIGAMGQCVMDGLRAGRLKEAEFAVLDHSGVTPERAAAGNFTYCPTVEELIVWQPSLVVECAGHAAVQNAVPLLLAAGISVVIASVGALSEPYVNSLLEAKAAANGAELTLVSGAIGGLDALRSARAGGLSSVKYVGRKPPQAWAGTEAARLFDLGALRVPTTIFTGNAREAARRYPRNANVTAAVALSGLGFDDTTVELVADPDSELNVHEVDARGNFGHLSIRLENNPLPANPKTSWLAALSIEEAILRRLSNVSF